MDLSRDKASWSFLRPEKGGKVVRTCMWAGGKCGDSHGKPPPSG